MCSIPGFCPGGAVSHPSSAWAVLDHGKRGLMGLSPWHCAVLLKAIVVSNSLGLESTSVVSKSLSVAWLLQEHLGRLYLCSGHQGKTSV